MLPATQPLVEMHHEFRRLGNRYTELERKMHEISLEIRLVGHQRYMINQRLNTGIAQEGLATNERLDFVRECPDSDCRGYLSTQWKCGVCEKWTCNQCHEIKGTSRDSPHECKPENVASAALVAKETRPCPTCHTHIFKIEGCFAKDTRILMYDGSIKLSQNIRVGDLLRGDDGEPRTVKQLARGQDWMYEIQQSHGMSYTVSSYHQLVFMVKSKYREADEHNIMAFTVNDYLRLHSNVKRALYGFTNQGKMSTIHISPQGKSDFYGWTTDGNRLFLLPDNTVVHNCNQMFCTKCNTPFDWRTGRAINGPVHNPHYFEWMRNRSPNASSARPPAAEEQNCNNQLTNRIVQDILTMLRDLHIRGSSQQARSPIEISFSNICRNVMHLQHVIVPQYEVNIVRANEKLRVKFLMNEIDEAKFKSSIQHNDKRHQQHIELVNVFEMVYRSVTDIIYRLRNDLRSKSKTDCLQYMAEVDRIVEYANGHLAEISTTYGSTVVHTFSPTLTHQTVQRVKRRAVEEESTNTTVSAVHA
jgi:hypothetical protein